MTEQQNLIFGIDLGTTYSCIAYVDSADRPVTIANAEGARTTPSVVFYDGETRIVGQEAKNNAVLYPDQVVAMVKRHMGQSDWVHHYDGTDYSAEEISSYILRKLVNDTERMLGVTVKDVVITCPAYFGVNEREATARAGEIAGLTVRSVINEPTAAAIAYGMHEAQEQVVLVYDLGGGTFDITMIEIKEGQINVIATGGDHNLGGRNWDEIIVNYLAEQWKELAGSNQDPLDDPETAQDLFTRAEQAKMALTAREKTDVAVTHAGMREKVTLTRDLFDSITANLLERTIEYTRSTLKEAEKKGIRAFDQILLVGGSTKMPQVVKRLQAEFGLEPKFHDPDESVAKGAALYAQKLAIGDLIRIKIEGWGIKGSATASSEMVERAREEVADELGLTLPSVRQYGELDIRNVTSRSFGVIALEQRSNQEIVRNLIRVNDTVPAQSTQRFGIREDNQENAEIRIVENIVSADQADLDSSEQIGEALLNLPSGLRAGAPVEITFQLDEQGRLNATARELSTNQIIKVDIQTTRVISEEKLKEAIDRSKQLVVS
ncbi:MAG: Hsp70 family protein [Ardenticatenales bacterium]|nr:Hsp70 family protein [Ardenticatenales bacterium]